MVETEFPCLEEGEVSSSETSASSSGSRRLRKSKRNRSGRCRLRRRSTVVDQAPSSEILMPRGGEVSSSEFTSSETSASSSGSRRLRKSKRNRSGRCRLRRRSTVVDQAPSSEILMPRGGEVSSSEFTSSETSASSSGSRRLRKSKRNRSGRCRLRRRSTVVDQAPSSEILMPRGGEVSSSELTSSETSASSSGSRRLRKSKRNRSGRRRLRRRSTAVDPTPSSEILNVVEYSEGSPNQVRAIEVANPPTDAATITRLPGLSWKHFLRDLKAGEIEQVCLLTGSDQLDVLANAVSNDSSSSRPKAAEPKSVREARFAAQSWQALQDSNNPVYSLTREFEDIFPEKIPAELPAERGVRHEIDLVPGSKYCVTRQWPRDQVQAIDEFFEGRRKAGHVRESISPHSSPTFCVKKATGGWRIVDAFNKLNDATILAQTPIPRKDMVLDTMSGSVIYSAIDLTDGFYQILMR
ncbi:hypothetical protein PF010_g15833 [Phytophthora fragariae]|uniref:Reverse transcriptase domain-containing protein n=1 Tax=Phytophthora fragariae TaxID=53985 RepID=A0A6G0KSU8_9STRA|nr:hypothetical protein PF010_g15833 [Phytophthora fragariae]